MTRLKEELQRTKEDLNDLETYLKEFSTFLPLAVCMASPIGIIIDINKAFEEITHYKPIELVGESLENIFLEKGKTEEIFKKAKSKRKIIAGELTLISKEKKEIPARIFVSIRQDEAGNFIGYFLSITDITEIKKFQETLEEKVRTRTKELEDSRKVADQEKNKTLAVIQNFADGLIVFGKTGILSLINPQAESFFNIKAKDLIGKTILELSAFPTLKSLVGLLESEIKGTFRKELLIKENLILEISVVSMSGGEEKLGSLVVLRDVTREKRIEKIKTEFVSLAAHQLRTPLSAVKWTIKMLLDGDLGEITNEQRKVIEKSYQVNEKMIGLINDLLDVAKIEEGRYLYKPTLADFENVVHFAINSCQEEIVRKKIVLDFEKPKIKLPKITMDVEKMRLVIQNLLDNAVKYTPFGGNITILLEYDKDKKEITFSIKDTGVGIPRDQQARVFTKFFRGANVMRMETEGTGLGLFISKNIIETHGGKIWFESKERKGTTFYFIMPIKKERRVRQN